ncbi:MAG: glycosyltransferase [Candidatus Margulisiibacteriota bacterium]
MRLLYANLDFSSVTGALNRQIVGAFRQTAIKLELLDFVRLTHSAAERLRQQHPTWPPAEIMLQAKTQVAMSLCEATKGERGSWLMFLNGRYLPSEVIAKLKENGLKIADWELDDPYCVDASLRVSAYCDALFTVDSAAVELHRANSCPTVVHLPLAYSPLLDDPAPPADQYLSDICFIGTPFRGSHRLRWIDQAAGTLARYRLKLIGSNLYSESWRENLPSYELLKGFIREESLPLDETVKFMRGAAINLNLHRDSYGQSVDRNERRIIARSPNERTFLLAGLGAFQLIDDTRPDLAACYELGREVVTFRSAAELEEKILYYLAHEAERKAIAAAARQRTLAEHTYGHRVGKIIEVISGLQ